MCDCEGRGESERFQYFPIAKKSYFRHSSANLKFTVPSNAQAVVKDLCNKTSGNKTQC